MNMASGLRAAIMGIAVALLPGCWAPGQAAFEGDIAFVRLGYRTFGPGLAREGLAFENFKIPASLGADELKILLVSDDEKDHPAEVFALGEALATVTNVPAGSMDLLPGDGLAGRIAWIRIPEGLSRGQYRVDAQYKTETGATKREQVDALIIVESRSPQPTTQPTQDDLIKDAKENLRKFKEHGFQDSRGK